jgi:tetratricopeptide (TPR) repeat protein
MHEPFLEHMADERYRERGAYTLAAFLVMRLVDRYAVEAGYTHPDALAYQENATLEYVLKLDQEDAEVGHLMELIRVSSQVRMRGKRKLLWAPLLAYAYWLEQELRLMEALDVVETAMRMSDGTAPEKEVAALLQQARILRLMGYFDWAQRSYQDARGRAEVAGDTHAVLLSRIGEAIVLRQKGNLPASERALREVLKDAERLGDRDAQARAHHDLGLVLSYRNRPGEGLEHLYVAYQLYRDLSSKMRALSDIGEALKEQGELDGSEAAFNAVVRGEATIQTRAYAMVGLIELARLKRDTTSFLWWEKCATALLPGMPVELQLELELQLGLGYMALGKRSTGIRRLHQALCRAQSLGAQRYVVRIEGLLASKEGVGEKTAPKHCHVQKEMVQRVAQKVSRLKVG